MFTTFFSSVAASLVGKLPNTSGGYAGNVAYRYYQDKSAKQSSFICSPVGEEDILKLLHSFSIIKLLVRLGCQLGFSKLGQIKYPLQYHNS